MPARPARDEAADYYFRYIDRVPETGVLALLQSQLDEVLPLFASISEAKSLYRYAPDKWSIRQLVSHLSDCERLFQSRAFWFARGFETPLPSFDEKVCAAAADADRIPWADHLEEFRRVRLAGLSFFRHLPEESWMRRGVASGNPFTVRALAYIIAGHTIHHAGVLKERYLQPG
jgi:DinB family protein